MVNTFDSRALGLTDCYGQRFMKPGTYHYGVLPVLGHCVTEDRPFTVQVVERTAKTRMTQHTLLVRAQKGRFRVEPPEVQIEAGDLVLWNCPDDTDVPYIVVGDKEFFASHRLVNESGYTHAFGSAGEYHWVDAYGSGVGGVVRVKDPGCKDQSEFQRWHKLLAKGSLVMIADGKAEPREIDILTGQTVYFAVTKSPGISITDRRLVRAPDTKPAGPTAEREPAKSKR